MITVLSGGTGTPKLLMGLQQAMDRSDIAVVANTGEDTWGSGTYISPDVDSVTYALAGIIDQQLWYGIARDTFMTHKALAKLGRKELLRLGDRDRATKLYRTLRLGEGCTLTQATAEICASLGVSEKVLPMSDDPVHTTIYTENGKTEFHDFWVRDRGRHSVNRVVYEGSEAARPSREVAESIRSSDAVVIGPSNPITSIGPILSMGEVRDMCKRAYTVAVSPIIGERVFSGPASRLMGGLGYESSPLGVARFYEGIADVLVIDHADERYVPLIKELGIDVRLAHITMKDLNTRAALGKTVTTLW